jgi:hypothetical protein
VTPRFSGLTSHRSGAAALESTGLSGLSQLCKLGVWTASSLAAACHSIETPLLPLLKSLAGQLPSGFAAQGSLTFPGSLRLPVTGLCLGRIAIASHRLSRITVPGRLTLLALGLNRVPKDLLRAHFDALH